jgi:hypothetical protein
MKDKEMIKKINIKKKFFKIKLMILINFLNNQKAIIMKTYIYLKTQMNIFHKNLII